MFHELLTLNVGYSNNSYRVLKSYTWTEFNAIFFVLNIEYFFQ